MFTGWGGDLECFGHAHVCFGHFSTRPEKIKKCRMRRKRHTTIYDTAGTISEIEAENIVVRAEKLVQKIIKMIRDDG